MNILTAGSFAARSRVARSVLAIVLTSAVGLVPAATGGLGISTDRGTVVTGDHWSWPTDPPHRILRGFEAPATRYSAGHRGIDIAAAPSVPVYAPTDAFVHFTGTVVDRPVVTLDADDGVLVSMEPVVGSELLHAHVRAGQSIGHVGRGAHCDNACVHLGVRLHGEYVSPLLYLGGIERAVLLPMR